MDAATWAAIGGSAVGIAGVTTGWLTSRDQRRHAVGLAREQHEHDARTARGGRLFDAKAAAYRELLRQLRVMQLWIERTHPIISFHGDPPPPDPTTEEEWERMYVDFALYGSDDVRAAFQAYGESARNFQFDAGTYSRVRDTPRETAELLKGMHAHREASRDRMRTLERLMRDELASL